MSPTVYKLREEEEVCLTLKEEAFEKLLEYLKGELEKNKIFKSGRDVIEVSKRVAQLFSEKYTSPRRIFEGKAHECKEFFKIFSESQLQKLWKFSQNFNLKVETKTFKEVLFEYLSFIFDLFEEKTKIKDGNTENFKNEIAQAWDKFLNGHFKRLIESDTFFKAKIATVKIKDKGDKIHPSDPFLLTYSMVFSPYGEIVKSLEKGRLKEDIKRYLEQKVLEKLKEDSNDALTLLGISVEEKLKKNEDKLDKILEGLFEAIDTYLRARINLEHFRELLEFAQTFRGKDTETQTVLDNLQLLKEFLEEDVSFWSEIVSVLPVGFILEDKISDFLSQKNFWNFLYTYRMKVNEIPEGASEQFLGQKAKTRAEYFQKMSKRLKELLKNPEGLKSEEVKLLPTYTKALLKLLFYYGKASRNLAEEIYELYTQIKELKEVWLSERDYKPTEGDKEILKKLLKVAESVIKSAKGYKKFHEFYEEIANKYLKEFVEELPFHRLKFLVAVDFYSLANYVIKAIEEGSIDPKTRRYRGVIKLLSPQEVKEGYEYILSVVTFAKNYRLGISKNVDPKVEVLKPLKDLGVFFNLTAELSGEDFGENLNKPTYRVAFALSFLLLSFLLIRHSEGVLIGFSLPPKDSFREFLYNLVGALTFAGLSQKVVAVQNFNWNSVGFIEVNKNSIGKGINFHINQNKKLNIKGKIENGLSSLYSNLPFEVYGLNLPRKVAILAVSHPEFKDKSLRAIVGEGYIFEPLRGKTLFENFNRVKVFRETFFGYFLSPKEDTKVLMDGYMETVKGFLKELGVLGVEKVYLIPPLPLYRGLSTKEVLFKEIYFSEVLESFSEILPTKEVFSHFAIVYTPQLTNLKRRFAELLKDFKNEGLEKKVFAVNLFEGIEKLVEGEGLKPFVIPKFAIIPLFSMEEGKTEKKTLNHHAFIYSIPSPEQFATLKPEKVLLSEEEKNELVNLLGIVHLIQYQKWDFEKKLKEAFKTFKRNPFYVFPVRRSGDKNIYTLTEFEVFFNSQTKPKLQTVLNAFVLMKSIL